MKIAAIILSVFMVVSLIGFGVTLLVTGFEGDMSAQEVIDDIKSSLDGLNIEQVGVFVGGEGYGEDLSAKFTERFSDIEISVISAKTIVKYSSDDYAYVEYKNKNSSIKLTAEVVNDQLIIKENQKISFPFINLTKDSVLTITIPEKLYGYITLSAVSGHTEVEGIVAEYLSLNTTSGSINIKAFAEDIEVYTVSGDINLTNNTDKRAASVTSDSVSGDITINGYRPDYFTLSSISGEQNFYGASGVGSINLTSGSSNVEYAEWNDDLEVSAISGSVNVKLPLNSGVELDLSKISGEVSYNLAGEKGNFNKNGEYSFGSSNKQRVDVNLTSGGVKFSEYDVGTSLPEYSTIFQEYLESSEYETP